MRGDGRLCRELLTDGHGFVELAEFATTDSQAARGADRVRRNGQPGAPSEFELAKIGQPWLSVGLQ